MKLLLIALIASALMWSTTSTANAEKLTLSECVDYMNSTASVLDTSAGFAVRNEQVRKQVEQIADDWYEALVATIRTQDKNAQIPQRHSLPGLPSGESLAEMLNELAETKRDLGREICQDAYGD